MIGFSVSGSAVPCKFKKIVLKYFHITNLNVINPGLSNTNNQCSSSSICWWRLYIGTDSFMLAREVASRSKPLEALAKFISSVSVASSPLLLLLSRSCTTNLITLLKFSQNTPLHDRLDLWFHYYLCGFKKVLNCIFEIIFLSCIQDYQDPSV